MITAQSAFAIGQRAHFYRQMVSELWALEQEFSTVEFDDVDDCKQFRNIVAELERLIERDAKKLPTGEGMEAIRQIGRTTS